MTVERPVMVSVQAIAYNHAKYIRQALDGFVMQKTNFRFEVIVHDDASTDGTADIIREYEAKYPGLIRGIYQKENQHSKKVQRNKLFVLPLIRGKYIALCECDDHWTDPLKLQKQFDALEAHPDCLFCVARVAIVDGADKPLDRRYPNFDLPTGVILPKDLKNMSIEYSFQTSSHFILAEEYRKYINDRPEYAKYITGDIACMNYFCTKGNFYYIDDTVSVYRFCSDGSWNERFLNFPLEKRIEIMQRRMEGVRMFDEYSMCEFHEACLKQLDFYERKIRYMIFHEAEKNKDYRTMLLDKYSACRSHWKKRDYCFAWLMAYCPWLMNSLRSLWRSLKR